MLRQLQDETGGFTAFITWPYQQGDLRLQRGNTSAAEYLRVQALARLFLDNIPHLQSSWVTQGPSIGQMALSFGADDFGAVMFEENVVSAAGTTFRMNGEFIEPHIRRAGYTPWRRNVRYQPAETIGSPEPTYNCCERLVCRILEVLFRCRSRFNLIRSP